MIQIIHFGNCPRCSKMCSQVSWQGNDPHEIPEFAKFAVPVLHCCRLTFEATQVAMLKNGTLITKQFLKAA